MKGAVYIWALSFWLCALFLATFVFVLGLLAALLLLPIFLVCVAWRRASFAPRFRNCSIEQLENAAVRETCGNFHRVQHLNKDLVVKGNSIEAHALFMPCKRRGTDFFETCPTMLLLHGSGSTAVTYLGVLEDLTDDHDVICLDWPGNGRSDGAAVLQGLQIADCLEFCVDFAEAFLQSCVGAESVYVMGMPFGGLLAIHLAAKYPARVNRLLLVCCAGLMPVPGVWSGLYGTIFKYVLPLVGPFLSNIAGWYIVIALEAVGADARKWFQFRMGSSPESYIPRLVSDLISFPNWHSLFLSQPALDKLAQLRFMPVAVAHGEFDPLCPPHIGCLVHALLGFPAVVMKGCGHSPNREDPKLFAELVQAWSVDNLPAQCVTSDMSQETMYKPLPDMQSVLPIHFDFDVIHCTFSPYVTAGIITHMYESLLSQEVTAVSKDWDRGLF